MLNRLGAKSAAGAVSAEGQRHPEVVDGHQVALRQVDLRWYRIFFGRAMGFYQRPPLPVLKVAWPDVDDRFHCEDQAEQRHRESQPAGWLARGAGERIGMYDAESCQWPLPCEWIGSPR
ncbi:DUF4262 domain-containing protein [Streptomyces sp. NPDC088846]|uniref:DUF4262 domain-containing protein n=1 Tax=Streptomyces sp. NPDC088846 TaxID=3365908 RepID=UPI0037FC663F